MSSYVRKLKYIHIHFFIYTYLSVDLVCCLHLCCGNCCAPDFTDNNFVRIYSMLFYDTYILVFGPAGERGH